MPQPHRVRDGPRRMIKDEPGGERRPNCLIDSARRVLCEGRTRDRFRHNLPLMIPRHLNILASVPNLNKSSKAGMTETGGLLIDCARHQILCPGKVLLGN